jgi:hypothetical protein
MSDNLKLYTLFKKNGQDPNGFKFGEAKLKTGELLIWDGDELKQGAALLIETPEGPLPPADNIYELEDGTLVEAAGGLVANVKTPDAAPAENQPPMEQNQDGLNEPQSNAVKRLVESHVKEMHYSKDEIDAKFKEAADKSAEKEKEFESKFSKTEDADRVQKLEEQVKSLTELVVKLSEQPATQPVVIEKTPFQLAKENEEIKSDRLMESLRKSMQKS